MEAGFHCKFPVGLLKIAGEDALTFLQGQFTQDLRGLRDGGQAYGLWLTQKGRVEAESVVLRLGERDWRVVLAAEAQEALKARLEAFVIADDVSVEKEGPAWALTVWGEAGVRWLEERTKQARPTPGHFLAVGPASWIFPERLAVGLAYLWVGTGEMVRPAAEEGLMEWSAEEMERRRIVAGIPRVPADIGPGELPPEGGLEQEGISYTKGCYLGQETIARLKASGAVRRRLWRLRGRGVLPPEGPQALYQGERKVAELRTRVALSSAEWIGLALVTLLAFQPGRGLALTPGGAETIWVEENDASATPASG